MTQRELERSILVALARALLELGDRTEQLGRLRRYWRRFTPRRLGFLAGIRIVYTGGDAWRG